jgi:hypothetical protein
MDDQQTKLIKSGLKEGQSYYPNTRTISGEWPKMATKGQGKGKKTISKACADQKEYTEFMQGNVLEKTTEED